MELFFFRLLDLDVGKIPLTALCGDKADPRVGVESFCAWAPITMSGVGGAPPGEWAADGCGERRRRDDVGVVASCSLLMAGSSRRSEGITRISCFVM